MPPRHPHPAPSSRGFGLIEMMVVVSLMAVLILALMPALKGSDSRLATEGNAVAGLAMQAQQNAFGRNMATALIAAQTVDGRQAFALFQLAAPTDGSTPTAANWTQLTAWKFLANGVAFDPARTGAASWPAVSPLPVVDRVAGKDVESVGALVFLPSSQVAGSDSATFPAIRLVEGTIAHNQLVYFHAGTPNYYNILINPSTGRAIVERPRS